MAILVAAVMYVLLVVRPNLGSDRPPTRDEEIEDLERRIDDGEDEAEELRERLEDLQGR